MHTRFSFRKTCVKNLPCIQTRPRYLTGLVATAQQQQPASACPARSFCVAAADVLLGYLLSCPLEPPCDREGVPPLYARAKFAAAAGV